MNYPEIYHFITPPIRKIGSGKELASYKKWRDKVKSPGYIRAMTIGGWDMYFPNKRTHEESMTLIREIVRGIWPHATYEQDGEDWFVHKDRDAQIRLDEFGVEDYLAGLYIYVVFDEDTTTVVYEKGTETETLAKKIKEQLSERA